MRETMPSLNHIFPTLESALFISSRYNSPDVFTHGLISLPVKPPNLDSTSAFFMPIFSSAPATLRLAAGGSPWLGACLEVSCPHARHTKHTSTSPFISGTPPLSSWHSK